MWLDSCFVRLLTPYSSRGLTTGQCLTSSALQHVAVPRAVARRPLTQCVRLSTNTAASIKLPKFLVTTVAPDNSPGRNKEGLYEGLYEFDSTSEGSTGEQPVFLLDVQYQGKSVNTDLDKDNDKGKGKFEGKAVSQVNNPDPPYL
eukprot:scaffold13471_cov66-Phaeocystis_antarctica.AAC.6